MHVTRQDNIIVDNINDIPVHSVAERLINLSSDESEDSDDEVFQQDSARNIVEEGKAVCFETELELLAAMQPITTCHKEDCRAVPYQ